MGLSVPVLLLGVAVGAGADALSANLRDYLLAERASERRVLEKKILATDGLTADKLAREIRGLALWDAQPPGDARVTLRLRKGASSEKWVWLHTPADYDPAQRWPLILAFHGAGGNPKGMLDYTLRLLGDEREAFIVAAPNWIGAVEPVGDARPPRMRALGFTNPPHSVGQPRALIRVLRRRFHIDNDRVYVVGYSMGASNAWMAAIMHADCFAGVVPLSHVLQIIGGTILYPELLPNCRNTRILFCWGGKDVLDAKGAVSKTGGIAGRSREMVKIIRKLGLKRIKHFELPDAGHRDVIPPADALRKLLHRRRRHYPKHVRQTFRLAEQSRAYWVSALQLQGEPLPGGNLQITVRPGEDPEAAKRRELIESLGLIEARCKGQRIQLRSRRATRVVLLLSDELLDLDKPVKIVRGKKKVFSGKIRRDLRVMLRQAAHGWDFDRLPSARVVIPVAGKIKFGYPRERR